MVNNTCPSCHLLLLKSNGVRISWYFTSVFVHHRTNTLAQKMSYYPSWKVTAYGAGVQLTLQVTNYSPPHKRKISRSIHWLLRIMHSKYCTTRQKHHTFIKSMHFFIQPDRNSDNTAKKAPLHLAKAVINY